ncbi:MAG: excisionase family DNA-binding protein [Bryobacteraceae bacterium]
MPPTSDLLTTGQAARLLGLTSGAVLKQIHAGRLPAIRTPGGHFRIPASGLRSSLLRTAEPLACWEFFRTGETMPPRCASCPAYRFRAARCFEVRRAGLAMPGVFDGCPSSCEACPFFLAFHAGGARVLAVTPDPAAAASIQRVSQGAVELRVVASGYEAGRAVDELRPTLVLVDAKALPVRSLRALLRSMLADPRLANARLAVFGPRSRGLPGGVIQVAVRRLSRRRLLELASLDRRLVAEGCGIARRQGAQEPAG